MTNSTRTYRQVDAPKHSGMYGANCTICGHEELTRPVWLQDLTTGEVFPVGPQCAANALQGVTPKEVKANARELRKMTATAERAAYVEWLYAECGTRNPVLAMRLMGTARFMNQKQWAAAA